MTKEIRDLDLIKVQATAWIRFKIKVEDENGIVIKVDTVDKAFNSQRTEVFRKATWTK